MTYSLHLYEESTMLDIREAKSKDDAEREACNALRAGKANRVEIKDGEETVETLTLDDLVESKWADAAELYVQVQREWKR